MWKGRVWKGRVAKGGKGWGLTDQPPFEYSQQDVAVEPCTKKPLMADGT